jgi:hypothetical protein
MMFDIDRQSPILLALRARAQAVGYRNHAEPREPSWHRPTTQVEEAYQTIREKGIARRAEAAHASVAAYDAFMTALRSPIDAADGQQEGR